METKDIVVGRTYDFRVATKGIEGIVKGRVVHIDSDTIIMDTGLVISKEVILKIEGPYPQMPWSGF